MAERVTQVVIEPSIATTNGNIRVTQVVVEASIVPVGNIRVTQVVIETSIAYTPFNPNVLGFLGNMDDTNVPHLTPRFYTAAMQDPDGDRDPGLVQKKNFIISFVVT